MYCIVCRGLPTLNNQGLQTKANEDLFLNSSTKRCSSSTFWSTRAPNPLIVVWMEVPAKRATNRIIMIVECCRITLRNIKQWNESVSESEIMVNKINIFQAVSAIILTFYRFLRRSSTYWYNRIMMWALEGWKGVSCGGNGSPTSRSGRIRLRRKLRWRWWRRRQDAWDYWCERIGGCLGVWANSWRQGVAEFRLVVG